MTFSAERSRALWLGLGLGLLGQGVYSSEAVRLTQAQYDATTVVVLLHSPH